MLNNTKRLAVVLINLGTPDIPEKSAIRRYLKEFLSDRRVVNIPRLLWLPILYLFILAFRPARLVHKYQLVWGTFDGPIRNISSALAKRTELILSKQHLGAEISVTTAMTYGNPSVDTRLNELMEQGYSEFLFIPLFPQYSNATTAAVYDQLVKSLATKTIPGFRFINDYHDHPMYIHALTKSVEDHVAKLNKGAKLVFSFHGIPKAQALAGDPYPEQCQRTAELVASQLGLSDQEWIISYQSRFGPAEWLQPYTSEQMKILAEQGVKNIVVICPGFATDCLETIEEIKILNRDIFLESGGQQFHYIKALNACKGNISLMETLVREHLSVNERLNEQLSERPTAQL